MTGRGKTGKRMTDPEKREALDTIILESERLRNLAKGIDEGFLAFLLENVLHEARATLIGGGHEPPTSSPSGGSTVVPLRPQKK